MFFYQPHTQLGEGVTLSSIQPALIATIAGINQHGLQQGLGGGVGGVFAQMPQNHGSLPRHGQAVQFGVCSGIGNKNFWALNGSHGTPYILGQQVGKHAGVKTAHAASGCAWACCLY